MSVDEAATKHEDEPDEWIIPNHIAVIMDGNGRWALERGLERLEGHYEGLKAARRFITSALDRGIEVVSLYAFSSENWSRPDDEVMGLMTLMQEGVLSKLAELMGKDVKMRVSGRVSELPEGLQAAVVKTTADTAENKSMVLNLCINYGGRAEIVDAARQIAAEVSEGRLDPEDVDEEVFASHLYNPDLPAVDLLIRPGGELRVSNFLLWAIAYAEFYATPVYWPDFAGEHLDEAIAEYNRRQRRFGGLQDEEA